ncbi:MAG: SUMF1/EgtB/PvdO family nonheme iron enzyme [Planctomycetota bacterium]|nr:SUMF1/EgtB/PvdO family nonheme iron enzyme [Planctomycetota bacterium]
MASRIKIEMSDLVDWEPLTIRLIPDAPVTRKVLDGAVAHVKSWFSQEQAKPGKDVLIKYWSAETLDDGVILVRCEHVGEAGVRRLTKHLNSKFPQYCRAVLGESDPELPSGIEMAWEEIPETRVMVDGNAVVVRPCRISRHHVTIDQYFQFMDATRFVPECETSGDCIFKGSQIASSGRKSGQWPVTHVCLRDAIAFADWTGTRLPTEVELYALFVLQHQKMRKMSFGNEHWTATLNGNGKAVVIDSQMPHANRPLQPIEKLRQLHPATNWDYPFISFRVLKEILGR